MEGKLVDQLQQSEAEKEKLIADMDQLRKDAFVKKEQEVKAAQNKARGEYSEKTFSCFYLIWKSNKDLNFDFLPEKTRAKELRKCLAREAGELRAVFHMIHLTLASLLGLLFYFSSHAIGGAPCT